MSESVPLRLVDDLFPDSGDGRPGDGQYYSAPGDEGYSGLLFRCPKCNHIGEVRLQGVTHWEWDGNVERPTCTPSILHDRDTCGWHGYLTDGVFVGL